MKYKKKICRCAAVLCALVVFVSFLSLKVPFYAAEGMSARETAIRSLMDEYSWNKRSEFVFYEDFSYIVGVNSSNNFFCIGYKGNILFTVDSNGALYVYNMYKIENRDSTEPFYYSNVLNYHTEYSMYVTVAGSIAPKTILYSDLDIFEFSYDGYSGSGYNYTIGECVHESDSKVSENYSSSLGYLKNINRQTLYLEDDAFSPVVDTLKYQFTFDNTTTTGLNITDGSWSVRHYMQVEVKNAKKEYETVEVFDKVLMGEYPAAGCKISYMYKDSLEDLHEKSGFDGLSWWESNGLGYITYYNDYFQLVRTNADGSVEYGGYVKVWQDEYNINHSTTLDEDESQDDTGYSDNIVSGSNGSGGTYEDAENDADKNAENAANANSEFSEQLNDMVSMVSAVPQLFAALFSFLPDWCLNLLGAGVGFTVILLIWKAVRG